MKNRVRVQTKSNGAIFDVLVMYVRQIKHRYLHNTKLPLSEVVICKVVCRMSQVFSHFILQNNVPVIHVHITMCHCILHLHQVVSSMLAKY